MTNFRRVTTVMALTMGLTLALNSAAQTPMDHSQMNAAAAASAASMTEGEVRKMDLDTGKITLKHGPIKHMDMPGMTMVFTAKDKRLLAPLKVGDKVQFMATNEDGKMLITQIAVLPS